ncbi:MULTISPECIES: hypothetical protein [unclassified Streptomyces]|uniref:Uncharacterized protein n=1 Tax=Streptomyces sp. NBC_00119 TaxID=2975659 RepID=A0AAU1U3T3_9ACTN|nr:MULTISPECIES: hypothetical protein [unclassified Streptomyces]MCX4641478.1 hypothetical protein [Streptomyces sp. NBC_01446]MCX5322099.1 hypothetical protein [Streptomyces sp. NBC_00120]
MAPPRTATPTSSARPPPGSGNDHARHAVTARLAELPCHSVRLGHDLAANADFLAKHLSG